jgi:hypothetical protein
MFNIVAIVDPRYKAPTYDELRGLLHQGENSNCTCRLDEIRESWEITRCIVMPDGWKDGKGKTLLNFLVSCPNKAMFIKSINASAYAKYAQ